MKLDLERPEVALQAASDFARNDLWFHLTALLRLDLVEGVHGDIVAALQRGDFDEILILLPRGHFKTHLVAGYVSWRIAKDRNESWLIVAVNFQKGVEVVHLVRQMLELPAIRAVYGDFDSQISWSTERFIVSGRTKPIREDTLSCVGIEAFRPGGHFSGGVVFEDVEDQYTVATPELKAKMRQNDALARPMVDGPGSVRITDGTFYADDDLYNHKLDLYGFPRQDSDAAWNPPLNGGRSTTGGSAVVFYKPAEDEEGNPLFPERFPREKLVDIRFTMEKTEPGSYGKQYLLNPAMGGEQRFPASDFVFIDALPQGLRYYISIDAARSMAAKTDRTGVAVVGLDVAGLWHVAVAREMQIDGGDLIALLFTLERDWTAHARPRMTIEEDGYIAGLKWKINDEQRKRAHFLDLTYVNAHARANKESRIGSLQSLFKTQSIVWLRGEATARGVQLLQRFPHAKRKDVPDALANLLEIAQPASKRDQWMTNLPPGIPPWLAKHFQPEYAERRKNQPYLGRRGDTVDWRSA